MPTFLVKHLLIGCKSFHHFESNHFQVTRILDDCISKLIWSSRVWRHAAASSISYLSSQPVWIDGIGTLVTRLYPWWQRHYRTHRSSLVLKRWLRGSCQRKIHIPSRQPNALCTPNQSHALRRTSLRCPCRIWMRRRARSLPTLKSHRDQPRVDHRGVPGRAHPSAEARHLFVKGGLGRVRAPHAYKESSHRWPPISVSSWTWSRSRATATGCTAVCTHRKSHTFGWWSCIRDCLAARRSCLGTSVCMPIVNTWSRSIVYHDQRSHR